MVMRAHIARVAVVGASLAAIAAAPAFGRTPPDEQYKASQLRSHALNVIYGLGHPTTMTHAEYRAVLIRSEALNERYGIRTLGSDEVVRLFATGLSSER